MAIFVFLCVCVVSIVILGYRYQRRDFLTIAAMVCFCLGGVQILIFESIIPRESAKVVFVLDVSKSMQARDIYPSRLSFAIKKLQILLRTHKPCSSIVIFAQNAYLFSPFSCDYLTQIHQLQKLDSSGLPWRDGVFESALDSGASNGALALEAARFYGENIIVLSDGEFVPKDATLWLFATPQGSVIEIDSALLYDESGNIVRTAPLPEAMAGAVEFAYSNKDIQTISKILGKNTSAREQGFGFGRASIALGLVLLFVSLYGAKLRYHIRKIQKRI